MKSGKNCKIYKKPTTKVCRLNKTILTKLGCAYSYSSMVHTPRLYMIMSFVLSGMKKYGTTKKVSPTQTRTSPISSLRSYISTMMQLKPLSFIIIILIKFAILSRSNFMIVFMHIFITLLLHIKRSSKFVLNLSN